MVVDIEAEVAAITRAVAQQSTDAGAALMVSVSRMLPTGIAETWMALTEPDRIRRWFLPVVGDLRSGGTFQLEGNASGTILSCVPPESYAITFGGPDSVVAVRLSEDGPATQLTLQHTVPIAMAGGSAGALYVGPGWDSALLALNRFLAGDLAEDPIDAANAAEGQAFGVASIAAWGTVVEASHTSDPEAIASARKVALAQFAPDIKLHGS